MSQTSQEVPEVEIHPEIAEMFKAGMHFGYRKTRRHPSMRQFIFGTKNNIEVLDLAKVHAKYNEALAFIRRMGEERRPVLFVGTKAAAKEAIVSTAQDLDMPYVNRRWLGGTITNFKAISDRVNHWLGLEEMRRTGEIKKYAKHEQVRIDKEIEKLKEVFGGLRQLKKLPGALIVVDLEEERIAVEEARKKRIPVVALSNTDTDPDLADYPIPGNDGSIAAIEYILGKLAAAYKEGLSTRAVSEAQPE